MNFMNQMKGMMNRFSDIFLLNNRSFLFSINLYGMAKKFKMFGIESLKSIYIIVMN